MIATGRELDESETKEDSKTVSFPHVITEIIQGYLCNDHSIKAKTADVPLLSQLSFFKDEALLLAHFAAYYVLWGQPDKIETLITSNPSILLRSVERSSPNGHRIKGTLYQLALWTDDNHIRNERGETFVEMIRRVLISCYKAKTEAQQRENWFRGWDEKTYVKTLKAEFDNLAMAFDQSTAITYDDFFKDTEVHTAIRRFKGCLSKVPTKKNCTIELWDHAALFYNYEKFRAYGGNCYGVKPKNEIFCKIILGSIDGQLHAWAIQVLLRGGLYNSIYESFQVERKDVFSCYYRTETINDNKKPKTYRRLGKEALLNIRGLRSETIIEEIEPADQCVRPSEPDEYLATEWPGSPEVPYACAFKRYIIREKLNHDARLKQESRCCAVM